MSSPSLNQNSTDKNTEILEKTIISSSSLSSSSSISSSSSSVSSNSSPSSASPSSTTAASVRSALWSFIFIVPVLAAVLAFYGFRGQDVLLGIDLGTTYSAIAYSDGISLGNIPDIDTLLRQEPTVHSVSDDDTVSSSLGSMEDNPSSSPSFTTPSIIAIDGGTFRVGRRALLSARIDPSVSIIDSKRIIGRLPNDPIVQLEAVRHEGRLIIDPRSPQTLVLPAKQSSSSSSTIVSSVWRTVFSFYQRWVQKKSTEPTILYDGPSLVFAVPLYNQTEQEIQELAFHPCLEKDAYYHMDHPPPPPYGSSSSSSSASSSSSSEQFHKLLQKYQTKKYLLLTPTAIGCIIVSHLYKSAQHHFPYVMLGKATVCIPAEFDSLQRHATVQAFNRAGLKVQRIMHEPTAAAMAYGLATTPNIHYVLVFDMGGGTLDVSILFLSEGSFTVIGSAGDNKLGGEDFDDCLGQYLVTQYQQQQQQQQQQQSTDSSQESDTSLSAIPSVTTTLCSPEILSMEAERVKIILSQSTVTSWSCPLALASYHHPNPTESSVHTVPSNISGTVTRQEFENACHDLFDRILVPVQHALEAANVQKHEINEIVSVGGSSRLPGVRERLAKYFDKEQLRYTVDPDLAVALGAAMNKA